MKKSFFRKNKKGVSPLIATVLLIAFAVALGAIVMSWGRSYIVQTQNTVQKKGSTDLTCSSDVSLEAVKSPDGLSFQVCTSGNSVTYTIMNSGQKKIVGFKAQVITSSESSSTTVNQVLSPGDIYRGNISYSGTLKYFSAIPIVTSGNLNVTCVHSGFILSASDVGSCS